MSILSTDAGAVDPIWDPFKDIIHTLYLDKNLSLKKVREEMATVHQFFARQVLIEENPLSCL
jgi:hypothetical protein